VVAHLGTGEVGGAVRIGLAHHTTRAEVAALVRCLEALD
jgi:selenocysteine lyase/cysteine desulfurase